MVRLIRRGANRSESKEEGLNLHQTWMRTAGDIVSKNVILSTRQGIGHRSVERMKTSGALGNWF